MSLLTVAALRAYVDFAQGDDAEEALQVLLDAAEDAITARYGPIGANVTEYRDGGRTLIQLTRAAAALVTVKEWYGNTSVTLSSDDYRLDGVFVERLRYGTHQQYGWQPRVEVTYTPVDDTEERKRVQRLLVQLDMNSNPGLTSETIGSWTQQYAANSVFNYGVERERILSSLTGSWSFA